MARGRSEIQTFSPRILASSPVLPQRAPPGPQGIPNPAAPRTPHDVRAPGSARRGCGPHSPAPPMANPIPDAARGDVAPPMVGPWRRGGAALGALARARPQRADMVMKSRAHQVAKYRAGVPAMPGRRLVPLAGEAGAVGGTGA